MRVNELVPGRQKHQFKHFVLPALETGRKTGQKTDQKLLTASVSNGTAVVVKAQQQELPLFMEPVFKAKDFDPL